MGRRKWNLLLIFLGFILLVFLLTQPQFLDFLKRTEPIPPLLSPPPSLQPQVSAKQIILGEPFTLKEDQEAVLSNWGLKIKVKKVQTPPAGTFDLPNSVTGMASYQGKVEEFNFIVGGNQPEEVENMRRQKQLFGTFNLYTQKIVPGEATFLLKTLMGLHSPPQ